MLNASTLARPPTCSVDAAEHLKVLTELTDCKERYYRLGADLRRLRTQVGDQGSMPTASTTNDETNHEIELLHQTQRALNASIAQNEALHAEFAQFRRDADARDRQARARIEALVAELETAKAYVDEVKQSSPCSNAVAALRRHLRDKTDELDAVVADNESLRQDIVVERARRHEASRERDGLRVMVQELQADLADAVCRRRSNNHDDDDDDDEAASAGVLSQLRTDNSRLCALLADTTEFARFKMHVSLEGASYVQRPGTPPEDNLMAWGRLVSGLQPRYAGKVADHSPDHFDMEPSSPPPQKAASSSNSPGALAKTEELRWVPSKVLHLVRAFQRRHCSNVAPHHFDAWVLKLHAVWHERCLAKVRHVVDAHRKHAAEMRRQVQHALPYDAVVHTREIERLRHDVLELTQKLLRGGRKGQRRRSSPHLR